MPSAATRLPGPRGRTLALAALVLLGLGGAPACATYPQVGAGTPPTPQEPGPPGWRVRTRDHVDLWLHGFAMLQPDPGPLTLFRPGYAARMRAAKNAAQIYSLLDANSDALVRGIADNPGLVNAHFVPLYFASWLDTREAVETFLAARGDQRRAADGDARFRIALLAQLFPTEADRNWLRLFVTALDDERRQFYQAWWDEQAQASTPALVAADSVLRREIDGRLRPYLRYSLLDRGDVVLARPLGGEGRSILRGINRINVAVTRPQTVDSAAVAVYSFVHEVVGPAVDLAIREKDAPADSLTRLIDAYTTNGLVRGGHVLLRLAAPDLADGYARYYLQLVGRSAGRADPGAALAAVFVLPDAVAQDIEQQISSVLRGI